jgi:hypothetical protein
MHIITNHYLPFSILDMSMSELSQMRLSLIRRWRWYALFLLRSPEQFPILPTLFTKGFEQ